MATNTKIITVQMTLTEASALVRAYERSTEQTVEGNWVIDRIGKAWREAVEARAAENDAKKEG